jgi:hypothetical protein
MQVGVIEGGTQEGVRLTSDFATVAVNVSQAMDTDSKLHIHAAAGDRANLRTSVMIATTSSGAIAATTLNYYYP